MLLILIWHAKSSDNKLYIKIELMNKCSAQPFLNSNALFSFYLGVRSFFSSQHWNFCARRQYDTLYICNWQFVYYTAKKTPLSKLTNSTYYDANFVCTVRFIMIFLYCMRKNQFVEKSKKNIFRYLCMSMNYEAWFIFRELFAFELSAVETEKSIKFMINIYCTHIPLPPVEAKSC